MADDAAFDDAPPPPKPRRSWPRRIARWTGFVILGLVALIGIFLIGLNSDAGRRFVVTQIEKIELERVASTVDEVLAQRQVTQNP